MRTRPNSSVWAWFYAGLYFLQVGWPGWAGAAAGAVFFLFARDLAGPEHADIIYWIGVGTFVVCVLILLLGKAVERTLELLNWILVAAILTGTLILSVMFVSPSTWWAGLTGMVGFDPAVGPSRSSHRGRTSS